MNRLTSTELEQGAGEMQSHPASPGQGRRYFPCLPLVKQGFCLCLCRSTVPLSSGTLRN
ncbi:MAG: hypothetical protein HQL73_08575 [Magnetococcales bacterium]|nr:hypothetical protein [Magnetococcales bacterium]